MKQTMFMTVDEVMKELMCSKAYAYKTIKEMNGDLKAKGFLVIPGKVPRKYFLEKCYGEIKA